MAMQTITALFDSREYANNAALMLKQAGIPDSDITVSPETATLGAPLTTDRPATGFWASLEEMFGGTDDHRTYAEGLRRGGTMLTAHIDDQRVDDAVSILEQHGSVDMDEKETSWRSEGWTGMPVTGGGIANEGAGPLRSLTPVNEVVDTPAMTTKAPILAPSASAAPSASPSRLAQGDDVLQVVEEELNVGKRAVNRGKVRIHSYVVEKAVSENVSLRDETISIDRRPVDRALGAADLGVDAFKDRTIEMEEINEEAVVAKTARVVEEIGIRKDTTDRTQTINDSVRSTKVDIEDGRVAGAAAVGLMDVTTKLSADMDVVGSDGQHVGVIDHVYGTTIKLKKMDPASGGQHHLIPTDWVQSVDGKVMLKTSASDVKSRWTAA